MQSALEALDLEPGARLAQCGRHATDNNVSFFKWTRTVRVPDNAHASGPRTTHSERCDPERETYSNRPPWRERDRWRCLEASVGQVQGLRRK